MIKPFTIFGPVQISTYASYPFRYPAEKFWEKKKKFIKLVFLELQV